jgi:hypothetical protein
MLKTRTSSDPRRPAAATSTFQWRLDPGTRHYQPKSAVFKTDSKTQPGPSNTNDGNAQLDASNFGGASKTAPPEEYFSESARPQRSPKGTLTVPGYRFIEQEVTREFIPDTLELDELAEVIRQLLVPSHTSESDLLSTRQRGTHVVGADTP